MPTYTMRVWRNENSQPENRYGLPFQLIAAYGRNAGFYKVQCVDPRWDTVRFEWRLN